MDRRFLFTDSFDSDFKLTKSASFSELSTSKKVIVQQQCQSDTYGNLVKQYSCEEIHDHKANESHLKYSEVFKSNNGEIKNIWKTTVPAYIPQSNLNWARSCNQEKNSSMLNGNPAIINKCGTEKSILSSPKLIIEKNEFKDDDSVQKTDLKSKHLDFQFKKPHIPVKKFTDKKEETSESSNTNVRDNEKFIADTIELKKKLRSLIKSEPKKSNKICLSWSLVFFILVLVTAVYLAYVSNDAYSDKFCNPRFKFDDISNELENRIYDQDSAINTLIAYFNEKNNVSSFEVLGFVGGTGVGKSYAAEIIKSSMRDQAKILDFFPPLYKKEDEAYSSLSVCRCNLIRLENLKTDDIPDAVEFVQKLKDKAENYCVLVLGIFNTQETNYNLKKSLDLEKSMSRIKKQFDESNVQVTLTSFTKMDNDALLKCIKDAADYNNLVLTEEDTQYVMRDLVAFDSGCKGAYAKVRLVGKSKTATADQTYRLNE